MMKPVSSILFATNLTENCRPAFDFAASMATRYNATIVLLHVLEKMPDYVDGRLRGLLGQKQWEQITTAHENDARAALIGKRPSNELIRVALDQFCVDAGIDNTECGYVAREIVVRDGEIVEEILQQSQEFKCDLIVMGARKRTFFSKETAIGNTIKDVLRRAKVPVLVVPPEPQK
ncbi:MAG: universal stress protein [Desulfobacterales bacterium]